MKYIIPFLTLLSFLTLSGCSRDDDPMPDDAGYYFRFKVNGTLVDYPFRSGVENNLVGHVNIAGEDPNLGSYYVCNLAGMRTIAEGGALNNNRNNLSVFLQQTSKFQNNIKYSNTASVDAETVDQGFLLGYYNESGILHFASKTGNTTFGDAMVQFEEITESSVKGSFSGTLEAHDISGGTVRVISTVTVTEGEFYVPSFYLTQ